MKQLLWRRGRDRQQTLSRGARTCADVGRGRVWPRCDVGASGHNNRIVRVSVAFAPARRVLRRGVIANMVSH